MEIGDGCPVCFMGGDDFLETVIQEINSWVLKGGKVK